jgi:hypothetical protein
MERLMRDPELRDRLGEAGPELAARFSWERSARSHREIYEELPPRPAEAPLPSRSGNRKAIF